MPKNQGLLFRGKNWSLCGMSRLHDPVFTFAPEMGFSWVEKCACKYCGCLVADESLHTSSPGVEHLKPGV